MNQVTIISASAGSGKTYRLSEALKEAVVAGKVRPEAVLATTFTRKAAAELQGRVRKHLLASGRAVDAQRLTAARIGTVNSVCGNLIRDYAFELGIRPDTDVLDEDAATLTLRRALSAALTEPLERCLATLSRRFGDWDWASDVQRIVNLARTNQIEPDDFDESAQRSKDGFDALLGDVEKNGEQLDAVLKSEVEAFLIATNANGDTTKTTRTAKAIARRAARSLGDKRPMPWGDWIKLANLSPGAKSRDAAEAVRDAAAGHDRHPQLQQDVHDAIDAVYELAAATMQTYRQLKDQRGVIDFVDQETLALGLLKDPAVVDQLEGQIDLVLIDEFQDTSPIQLVIFLKLAEIAPQSIWVGDQKQAIFAFRGADPALMDAAIAQILAGQEPETLPRSYRSRPNLVRVTSKLFAGAFEEHDVPAGRVVLEPAQDDEPDGLGPIAECWSLEARNQANEAAALAAAIAQMLEASECCVRDRASGQTRPVEAQDIGVLCRKNDTCSLVARELALLDVDTRLPRDGLLATPEAHVVLDGLRLWADPADALAAAELARLIEHPEQPGVWLSQIVDRPGAAAFEDASCVRALLVAREAAPFAGLIDVVDAVATALNVPELCRRWGEAGCRLANLERLRGYAVTYASQCATAGAAATPAGLIAYLEQLADEQLDHQGVATDGGVTLSTWHRAKGLEWPVTILFELKSKVYPMGALGVHVESDREGFDLADPLADRWVRFWPYPYGGMTKDVPMLGRLASNEVSVAIQERAEREQLRLLYVGWTRARDRVILAGRDRDLDDGVLEALNTGEGGVTRPEGGRADWGGMSVEVTAKQAKPIAPAPLTTQTEPGYTPGVQREYPAAFIQPSSLKGSGVAGEPEVLGDPIPVDPDSDWRCLGEAVHGFMAADRPTYADSLRRTIADRQLNAWGVGGAITPDDLITASGRLAAWAHEQWPSATWHRECPLQQVCPNGSMLRGRIDLVLDCSGGIVVIDHKSFPGSVAQATPRAVQYTGQLVAYAHAIAAATGKPILRTYVHMPITGVIIPLAASGNT